MYTSTAEIALVPVAVVTVTSTAPTGAAGEVAAISVSLKTVKVAGVEPNVTCVAPVKPVPEMNTLSPPTFPPDLGERLVTVGAVAALAACPATACSASRPGTIAMTATMARNSSFSLSGAPGFRLCPALAFTLADLSAASRPRSTLSSLFIPPGLACYKEKRGERRN